MKKQILLFLLMLMPLMASAKTLIKGIYYILNSSTVAEVTYPSGTSKYSGSIVIPNTVTYGGVIYSVTSIGDAAFSDCSDLISLTIPNSVTSIGNSAFSGCSSLTSLTIPNRVTSIGGGAFSGCSSLTSITVENGNAVYDSRNNCNAIVKTSTNELIIGCKSTTIPNSVTSIGNSAFQYCSSLTSVTIPNSVTTIGNRAFWGCYNLTSVTIPNSVTYIGNGAFGECSCLPIVDNCRYADTYLVEVVDKTIATCTIKEGTRFIGNSAFDGSSSLTSVTIPNDVTSIGEGAFSSCI